VLVPIIALGFLIKKTMDWIRIVVPQTWHATFLIPLSFAIGIGYALLFSASDILAANIEVLDGVTLADADVILVIVYGILSGAAGGVIHDFVKPTTPPHDGT
jgi:uncharacterized membrane protein YeiH